MGAVHFTIDPVLARRLTELLPLRAMVPMGPAAAEATDAAGALFDHVHAIETPDELDRIREDLLDGGVLYWHDPNPPPDTSTREDRTATGCELLAELDAIGPLPGDSVVMIDDARLLMAPPPPPHDPDEWPDLNAVLPALRNLSAEHELMVIDDAIVFYPSGIRDDLRQHARQRSTDSSAVQPSAVEERLTAVTEAIQDLAARGSEDEDRVLQRVSSLEYLYSRRFMGIPGLFREAKRRANRLAALRHYPPRPLRLPAHYHANGRLPDAPAISIVTPSLNHAEFLPSTIESVLGQSYPSLEYVVQDGGSNDGTGEILERYAARLHHCESAPDGGQTEALNIGFAHTSGEVMAYLNSDDMLLPGTVHYVARYFQEHPEVDVVYGHRILVDEHGDEIGRWVLPPHDDEVLSWADFVPQETLFWRRSAWDAAGGSFDESFRFAMDWDALVRLRDAGARMVRLPRFLGAFRVHDEQKTTSQGPTLGLAEMDRIRRRLHGRDVSQAEVLRHIRPYLIRHVLLDQLYQRGLLRY